MQPIPLLRLRAVNSLTPTSDGDFILYWMRTARRGVWNFSLQHAVHRAMEMHKPLLILETLACDEPFSSLRHHHFALDGMADNTRQFANSRATYRPFIEEQPGQILELLQRISTHCCLLVSDDHPLFENRQQLAELAKTLPVAIEAVDGNGILPLRAADRPFTTACSFRRFLQRQLPGHLLTMPLADPLTEAQLPRLTTLPEILLKPSPESLEDLLFGPRIGLLRLPVDQQVAAVGTTGGHRAALDLFQRFMNQGLPRYVELRNQPEQEITSNLSAHLRWGHMGSQQLVQQVLRQEHWTPGHLAPECRGQRSGWWGLNENSEAFLDQLITWRELGYLFCAGQDNYRQFDSLPPWAQATLDRHADDPRPTLYSKEQLSTSLTHDPLWNAAQRQLVREGRLHNYLRMLWGKKILEWSPSPQQALAVMIELNDRFALDGRDPNSYSGIGWCLGRFDRAWGPRRPIFGTIRYMSSVNTARKVSVKDYLRRYSEGDSPPG